MANDLTLSVTLTGDGRQLSGTLRNARGEVQAFGGTTERESGRAERALDRTGRQAQTVSGHLNQMRNVALGVGGALAAMGVASFVSDTYDAVSSSQQLQASLKTVTGSIENASVAWDTLLGFAAETPFTLDQSVQAFIRMQSLGLNPSLDALRSYGNTASAMGKDMMQMVEAVADATTGEFERLKEFGIRSSKEGERIIFTFQGVTTSVTNSADAISQYLQEIGESQFAGAMADQMDTLSGKASNLEDTIYQLYLAIGDAGATQVFAGALANASNTVQFLTDNIDTLASGAEVIAVLLSARVAVALATATTAMVKKTLATQADARAEAVAAQQTVRRTAAELQSANVIRARAVADAKATAGTNAHAFAMQNLTAASARATAAQAAHTSATNVATAAMGRASVMARGLSGGLALIGGPLGAAMLAGGAIYYFREELGLTEPKVTSTEEFVRDLSAGIDTMSAASLNNRLDVLRLDLAETSKQAITTAISLSKLEETEVMYGQGMSADRSAGIEQRSAQLEELRNEIDATTQTIAQAEARRQELIDSRKQHTVTTDSNTDSTNTNTGSIKANAAAIDLAAAASKEYSTELDTLRKRLQPGYEDAQRFAKGMSTVTIGLAAGKIGLQDYTRLVGLLQEELHGTKDVTNDLADNTVKAAYTMEGAWEEVRLNGLRRLDDGFASLWENAIDGSLNAGELMKKALAQTLAEMAHMAMTRPVTVQLASSMGLNGGVGGGAGGQSMGGSQSFGGMPSLSGMMDGGGAIANAYRAFQGTGSTYAGTFGSELAVQTEGGLRAGFDSFAASGLGNAALGIGGGIAGGYAGTEIGSAVFGKTANSNYGAMGGAALGQALIPIPGLGAAIGGAVGGFLDSAFGSGKKTFDFDFVQGERPGIFGDRSSALGDFGVAKFSDFKLGEQQDALQDLMDQLANFDNTLANAAIDERVDAMRASIEGFTHSGPEDLFDTRLRALIDGSGALVESAIAQIVDPQQMADAFLSVLNIERVMQTLNGQIQSDVAAHLEANTANIQGTADSLTQAINATVMLGNSARRLNLQFDDTSDGAIHYAWSMQEAVGGLESLNNMSNSYFQNYFTAAEREAMHREELTRSMQELGFELPKTRDGFRDLMEAQDLNTAAGVQNAAALMQLEGAFAQLTPAINETGSAAKNASAVLQERAQLERELLRAQGNTAALRELELSEIDKSNRIIKQQIWAIKDAEQAEQERARAQAERQRELDRQAQESARAAEEAARAYQQAVQAAEQAVQSARQQVQQSYQRFDQQQFDLQLNYLELLGDGEQALAMQRERELQTIDESLRPFQERLWALQDEAKAQQQAREASRNYVSELERVRGELSGAFGNINGWIDQQNATSGTPEMNLASAQEQLARQLVLAENGDRSALQGITQYADRVLQANDAYNASSSAGQRVESDVIKALKGLPKALSAEEFLAKEITDKLGEVITSFDDMIKLSLADEIERAVFASQYTIGTLIDFAVGSNDLPDDLRTVLGNQAHRLDSTINYLIGTNELDQDDRALALNVSNNLVSTVDQLLGSELSWTDKRLALNTTNTLSSTVDLTLGSDVSKETRKLALLNSNTLVATIDAIQSGSITADTRALALNSTNAISTDVHALLGSNVSSAAKQLALKTHNAISTTVHAIVTSGSSETAMNLALEGTNSIRAFVRAIDHRLTDEDAKAMALNTANAITTTVSSIMSSRADDDAKQLALNTNNAIVSDVNAVLASNVNEDAKRLALETSNTLTATVGAVMSSGSSNAAVKLALQGTNSIRTFVRGLEHRLTDADAKSMALDSSNIITATIRGLMDSRIPDDAKKLALGKTNTLTTTIKAALADGALSRDERRLIDTQSETVVKTLKTSGGLSLNRDEWAVINAASGTQRLQLLADVAFGRADLDELSQIKKNTEDGGKSIGQRAKEQADALRDVSRDMTQQLAAMNALPPAMNSLQEAIGDLKSVMATRASETAIRNSIGAINTQGNKSVSKLGQVKNATDSVKHATDEVDDNTKLRGPLWDKIGSMEWEIRQIALRSINGSTGIRVSWAEHHKNSAFKDLAYQIGKEVRYDGSHATGLWNVGFDGYIAELHKDEMVVPAAPAKALRELASGGAGRATPAVARIESSAAPIPSFPLLGKSDVADLLRDLKREVAELRKENAKLQGESNKHLAAANNQRGAAAKGQIAAVERGNKMLKKLEDDKRLEAAKR